MALHKAIPRDLASREPLSCRHKHYNRRVFFIGFSRMLWRRTCAHGDMAGDLSRSTQMSEELQGDHDPELDRIVEEIERQERKRRHKTLLTALVVVVFGIASLSSAILWRNAVGEAPMDVEGGEKKVLENTNDPQCRGFIADITAQGVAYRNLIPALQNGLIGGSADETRRLVSELDALRKRIADARAKSVDANLRFPQSRSELEDWFRYTDRQLEILQALGTEKLEPPETSAFKRPAKDVLEFTILACDDAFENFRVWHTSSLHPCGAADPDEKGWEP